MSEPFFHTDCPSCGAPVHAHSPTSVTLVCGYCNSMLVRQDGGIIDKGRDSALLEDFSPLQIGTRGRYGTAAFNIIGRLQMHYDAGVWNEWHILFDEGGTGWLSESGDIYSLTRPQTESALQLPPFDDIRAGFSTLDYNGKRFMAADVRRVTMKHAAAQGELPFEFNRDIESRTADWRCENLFLTTDYGDDPLSLYIGNTVKLDDLQLENLRTEDQIAEETRAFNQLVMKIYRQFGFHDVSIKLSLRPEKRAGSDEIWDKAEQGLRDALTACGVTWQELPGEGAFYGPKVEYHIKDALGRSWQCGTIQLDFVLPERLDAEYVTRDNNRARPVMLHRAILGSLERFIGILIEQHAGSFPLWLAPVQMVVMNITEKQADYCREVVAKLQAAGFRAELDLRNEKIGYKIRDNSSQRYPYQIVVGDKEMENGQVAVRKKAEDLGSLKLEAFIERLQEEMKTEF